MTVLLKQSIFSDCFPYHQPQGFETDQDFFCMMCEDQLVKKKTFDPVSPVVSAAVNQGRNPTNCNNKGVSSLSSSLKRQNPSPKPLGSHINVVKEVTVSSDQDLLQYQDSMLECLGPLLATSNNRRVPQGANDDDNSPPPQKRQRISTGEHSECSSRKANDRRDDDRTDLGQTSSSNDDEPIGLTDHQAAMWTKRFEELVLYREKFGHCLVPHKWSENLALATWVKRQRYQWKLRDQGKRSTLTKDRREALDTLGFVWDSHNAIWEERFNELVEFKRVNGNVNVPSTYKNHTLSVWVQCQRRQWKVMKEDTSGIETTTNRIKQSRVQRLEALGFVWEPRKNHHRAEARRRNS